MKVICSISTRCHPLAQLREVLRPQIGRQAQALAGIAPAEGLPGEPVLLDREIAGEALDPAAQQRGEVAAGIGLERVELGRRDAQAEIGRRQVRQLAHELAVEHRRQLVLEQLALLGHAARVQHPLGPLAVQPAHHMPELDGAAEQAVAVEVAAEHRDPPAAGEIALVPEVAHLGRQVRGHEPLVQSQIVGGVRLGEEGAECLVVRQMAGGGELELRAAPRAPG